MHNSKTAKTMKNLVRSIVMGVGLAAIATGCASGPKFSEYRATVSPPVAGNGRIWVYRPSALGMAVQPDVKLDDRAVGNAVPHGFFHVDTQPGNHQVSVTTEWKHETPLTVATNMDSYVRLEMMMGLFVGHVIPKEVPEAQAVKEMKNLHFAAP